MGKQDCESILLVLLYPVSPPEKDSSHSLIGTTPVNSTIGYIVNDPGKWFSPQGEVLRALGDPRLQDGKFRTRLASKVFFLDPFSFVSVAPGFFLVHSLFPLHHWWTILLLPPSLFPSFLLFLAVSPYGESSNRQYFK